MRVLTFTPVYRWEPETRDALYSQDYEGPVDFLFARDNPFGVKDGGKANILHQYRRARGVFLAGAWEALFCLESDLLPPADALSRLVALLDAGADVAYGLYLYRRGAPYPTNVLDQATGAALNLRPGGIRADWGEVVDCQGSGLGCTLIRREVLEQLDFRDGRNHCDTQFTDDLRRRGYVMMADLAVVCGHKRPDGTILWPAKDGRPDVSRGLIADFRGQVNADPTEEHERKVQARRRKDMEQPYMIYIGQGAFMPGMPQRDLTRVEWEELTEGMTAAQLARCERLYRKLRTKGSKAREEKAK